MIIGFFDCTLDLLQDMKNAVRDFPVHEYIFYGDTLNAPYASRSYDMLQRPVTTALAYLGTYNCTVIVLGKSIPVAAVQSSKLYDQTQMLLSATELVPYLESVADKEDPANKLLQKKRSIHLTQYDPDSEKKIAAMLGGHFIEL